MSGMNITRRQAIQEIQNKLANCQSELETHLSDEQDYFDNMPESLQGGDKGDKAQQAVDAMQESIDLLSQAVENLNSATE